MHVDVKVFTSNARAMGDIAEDAAAFASTLRPDRLISISHSKEGQGIWICVWYWVL